MCHWDFSSDQSSHPNQRGLASVNSSSLLLSAGRPKEAIRTRRSASSGFSSVLIGRTTAVGATAIACRLPPMLMLTVFNCCGTGIETINAVAFLALGRYPSVTLSATQRIWHARGQTAVRRRDEANQLKRRTFAGSVTVKRRKRKCRLRQVFGMSAVAYDTTGRQLSRCVKKLLCALSHSSFISPIMLLTINPAVLNRAPRQ